MKDKMKEFREKISEEFLKSIEENPLTWKKSWHTASTPYNGLSKRPYRGINRFILQYVANKRKVNDPRWFTFNQVQNMELKLKRGCKGEKVEFYFLWDKEKEEYITFQEYDEYDEKQKEAVIWRARYYTVFNGSDIEGLEPFSITTNEIEPAEAISLLTENMGIEIFNDGGDQAYYSPSSDLIHLPLPEVFLSSYEYNATALHELAHSTGHISRLNRATIMSDARPGEEEYAQEELIAELTSCYIAAELPINQDEEHLENHKAYFQVWGKRIKDNPEYLMKALKEAEKAAAYMEKAMSITKEIEKNVESEEISEAQEQNVNRRRRRR